MENNTTFDTLVLELKTVAEKSNKLMSRTKRLCENLDNETKHLMETMGRIKKILGIEDKLCPICCRDKPLFCIDICHHLMCELCAKRCLRSTKCYICRANATAIFKIFI